MTKDQTSPITAEFILLTRQRNRQYRYIRVATRSYGKRVRQLLRLDLPTDGDPKLERLRGQLAQSAIMFALYGRRFRDVRDERRALQLSINDEAQPHLPSEKTEPAPTPTNAAHSALLDDFEEFEVAASAEIPSSDQADKSPRATTPADTGLIVDPKPPTSQQKRDARNHHAAYRYGELAILPEISPDLTTALQHLADTAAATWREERDEFRANEKAELEKAQPRSTGQRK